MSKNINDEILEDELNQNSVDEKMKISKENAIKIGNELKKEHNLSKVYYVIIQHEGLFIIKSESMAVAKKAKAAMIKYADKELKKFSENSDNITAYDAKLFEMSLERDSTDIQDAVVLKECVLYPKNFAEKFDKMEYGVGVSVVLIEKINEYSGWGDVVSEAI